MPTRETPLRARRPLQRALFAGYLAAHRALRRLVEVSAELPTALHCPALERISLDSYYRTQRQYQDAQNQRSGLLRFEERMVDRYFPRPPARLLLHGAGGGRELFALLERGYELDAFEPVAELAGAANRQLPPGSTPIQSASIQDWCAAWRGDPPQRYDGVIVGWAAWTHVIRQADRLGALRRFAEACPRGPVLLSFFSGQKFFDELERSEELAPLNPAPRGRLQGWTRVWLRQKVFQLPPLERGTGWARGFYYHFVTEAELRQEASQTGWRIGYYEREASKYPHAVLLPASSSPERVRIVRAQPSA
jgi:hypothetical protein